jgi:uncharacterized membrane protein
VKRILQGKWLGHPLHPIMSHVPVAVWPAALLFDVFNRVGWGGNLLVQLSFFCIAFGLAAGLFAIPTGIADWWDIKREKPAWKLGVYHMVLNIVATVVFAANLAIRVPTFSEAAMVATVPMALSAAGTLLILVSAYLGGLMIYDHGISVARTSKEKWRKMAEASGSNVSQPDKQP